MRHRLESFARRLWSTQRPPALLRGLSRLYRYALGSNWQRPAERPACPVIVVGNLTVGGTGKTPVVMALARHLLGAGHKPAIISRGYRGKSGRSVRRVEPGDDPRQVGDEPALMAASLEVPVWIARRRSLALQAALEHGADVVIADDGLQHRDLPRSFEIVVVDGRRGLGNGCLLPAGPLRGPPERLEQADRILIKGPRTAPDLPSGPSFELRALALVSLADGSRRPPDSLAGRQVSALCGIGHPDQFASLLEKLDMRVELHAFPDHHDYRLSELDGIDGPIVTTAKDAVKLKTLGSLPVAVEVLEVEAALPAGLIADLVDHVRKFRP